MKHINGLLLALASACLILTGCSRDGEDFYINPKLEVSSNGVMIDAGGGSKHIGVTVNEGDSFYTVISESTLPADMQEWVTISESEEGFVINATANTEGEIRKAKIVVGIKKGNLTEIINVSQSPAADGKTIIISEDNIRLTPKAAEFTLYVSTLLEWTVSTESDWIIIEPDYAKNKMTVNVGSNEGQDRRAGTIDFIAGTTAVSVSVVQRGIFKLDFPYLEIGYNYEGETEADRGLKYKGNIGKAFAFEEERGSTFLMSSYDISYLFYTTSPSFPVVLYAVFADSRSVYGAIYSSVADEVLNGQELIDELEFEGFKYCFSTPSQDSVLYWNPETKVQAWIDKSDTPDQGKCIYFSESRFEPDRRESQQGSYATFEEMPYPCLDWTGRFADIQAWESETGSTLLEYTKMDTYAYALFTPDPRKEPLCAERVYYFDGPEGVLYRVISLFNSTSLMFYWPGFPHPNNLSVDDYVMTKEFKGLLANEGFVLDRMDQGIDNYGAYVYYNDNRKLAVAPLVSRYESEGYMPRSVMHFMPQNGR